MSRVIVYKHIPSQLSPAVLLDWLIFAGVHQYPTSTLRVFWDLDDSISPILALLPDHIRQSLSRPPHRAQFGSYRLYYIPSKVFAVSKNHIEASFYDLSQYFPGDPEPSSITEFQEKADLLMDTLSDLGVPAPTTLSSPVASIKGSGLLDGYQTTIPTVFDAIPSHLEAYELALQCTPREWVSNYQVGHWAEGELWNYDRASSYPADASNLLDLRDCSFSKSTEMDETAYYGFLEGDFTVYPDHPLAFCSPLPAQRAS